MSTHTAADELKQILTEYCIASEKYPDIERVKNLLSKVSDDQRYELLSSVSDEFRYTVLTVAAHRGHIGLPSY